jgi:uncharacterized membrane protein
MSASSLQSAGAQAPAPIRFVLTPYRSLSRSGFLVLMAFIGGVSFVAGLAFAMMGAWPVLGFFGLDVALVWYAFHRNYCSARQLEVIEIADGRLTLIHQDAQGVARSRELTAAWVDVRLREAHDGRTSIALASHGREHAFGAFLNDDERRELAPALREALLVARGGPRT